MSKETFSRPLRRHGASEYLFEKYGIKRAPATLAKIFCTGGGPVVRKAGRVPLYDTAALDAWAEGLLSPPLRSSSQKAEG